MDTDRQRYELEATGAERGLYEDVRRTFRAPFVNWILRTLTANAPVFTRYLWGQVKPLFETRAFARLTVEYRDAVLSKLEADAPIPTFRRTDTDLSPAEYRELREQVATFDVVAPRLAVLFEAVDRALCGDALSPANAADDPDIEYDATAPYPAWLDRDRGAEPTMVDTVPESLAETADGIRAFHGFDDTLPSIYRCLAQWPGYLDPAWDALAPRFESSAFEAAVERSIDLVDLYVDDVPYQPRLTRADLRSAGFPERTVEGAASLFRTFNSGPVLTVLPALPVWAATVGEAGERSL
jgi:hypothetical protein